MKYRIIQRGDGKFIVEESSIKKHYIKKNEIIWTHCVSSYDDYPEENENWLIHKKDCYDSVFCTLELAQKKVKTLIENKKLQDLKKIYKVIEEREV